MNNLLVILHSNQLESMIRRSLHEMFKMKPERLSVDSRYLIGNQGSWEVSAEFDDNGSKRHVKLRINPQTGQITRIILPPCPESTKGGEKGI